MDVLRVMRCATPSAQGPVCDGLLLGVISATSPFIHATTQAQLSSFRHHSFIRLLALLCTPLPVPPLTLPFTLPGWWHPRSLLMLEL